jgi:dTDP-4-amino-4,6-dideoxygalactose transaminase
MKQRKKTLEKLFARLHRRRWAVFTSSGTGALMAGLATLKEIYRWSDDLGLPADMKKITAFAKKYKLKILEDSCDTMFVGIGKRPVGSFGNLAAFSTYVAHLLPTGVGDFLVGDDDSAAKPVIQNRFRFDRIGFHYRLTEMEAAIGLSQLEKGAALGAIKKRQALGQYLISRLKPLENRLQLPYIPRGFDHAFMMFPLLIIDKSINRWQLMAFLEKNGIETRELLPLLNQPAYRKTFSINPRDFPRANFINQRGLYFGCHPSMTWADMDYIAGKIYEFLEK